MLAFFVVLIVFSIVILVHELGHFIVARRMRVRVERFSLGFGRALWSKKIGETEYAISSVPFGGYIKMSGEEPSEKRDGKPWEFYTKPPGKRFWILIAGAGVNYILAFLIFCFIAPTSRVGMVLRDMPAYKAGIQPKDKILYIDDKKTRYWYDVLDIVSKDVDARPLRIGVERDGKVIEFTITPELIESKGLFARAIKTAKIGIGYSSDVEVLKDTPFGYLKNGFRQIIDNTNITYRYIWYLITGKVSVKGSVTGPVGIAVILGRAARIGLVYLLYLIGHINLALAIFNLLPFPVLDGGHIMFLGLEKLRKRPLSLGAQEKVQYVAVTLLIVFFLFVSYNDITLWLLKR